MGIVRVRLLPADKALPHPGVIGRPSGRPVADHLATGACPCDQPTDASDMHSLIMTTYRVVLPLRGRDKVQLTGSPLACIFVGARYVNHHEVRRHTLVVDNELVTESQAFEQRL